MAMCYVGMAPCVRMVAAIVDSDKDHRSVATCVAQWIRHGLIVERATGDVVRAEFEGCPYRGRECDDCPERHGNIPLPGLEPLGDEKAAEDDTTRPEYPPQEAREGAAIEQEATE